MVQRARLGGGDSGRRLWASNADELVVTWPGWVEGTAGTRMLETALKLNQYDLLID